MASTLLYRKSSHTGADSRVFKEVQSVYLLHGTESSPLAGLSLNCYPPLQLHTKFSNFMILGTVVDGDRMNRVTYS
jgi:hypothetical protein